MFTNKLDSEERGQVGIGTLIVFIALVLVAAIAAGVLINTAGFLQSQAEATGQESTDQVSNNINVFSAVGEEGTATDAIGQVTLTVGMAPGSDAIDLEQIEIEWINGDVYRLTDAGTDFTINNIEGADNNQLDDAGDRVEIVIDAADDADAINPGDSADVTITTSDGSQTSLVLSAPSPFESPTEL